MKRFLLGCTVLVLLTPATWAGVVVQMEVKGSDSAGEAETLYAQGEMARMDSLGGRKGSKMSMIFRDETMWFLDHGEKVAQKIDKEGIAAIGEQMDAAMKQMENIPPEQRAMMEKMMKGGMPGMGKAAPRRMEKGGSERVGEYACTVHTLYSGEQKKWEACAAGEGVVKDLEEAMDAFRAMSRFTQEMMKAVQKGPIAAMVENPYNDLEELDGFPVRTRMFNRSGGVLRETTLKSVTRKNVEAAVFEIPSGYKVKDLKDQIQKRGKRGRKRR